MITQNTRIVQCKGKAFNTKNKMGKGFETQNIMSDLEGYLTPIQINRVLANVQIERNRMLILFGWRSGRRISEILNVRKKDINFDRGVIKFRILKKRKNKDYYKLKPIDSGMMRELKIYTSKFGDDDFIFKGYNEQLSRRQAYNIIREACEGVNIYNVGTKPPHPHHLRHSFAVNFLRRCKNPTIAIKILQEILEHTDLKTTSFYLQFSQEDIKKELENVFAEE